MLGSGRWQALLQTLRVRTGVSEGLTRALKFGKSMSGTKNSKSKGP